MNRINSYIYLCIFICSILFLASCDTLKKTTSTSNQRYARNSKAPVKKGYSRPAPSKNTARTAPRATPSRPAASTANRNLYTRTTPKANVPKVVEVARTYTGTPYRSGGNDKDGIDCSGLICSVYSEIGVKVPRISWQQSEFGSEISNLKEIKEGDWLFFVPEAGKEGYVSHAGIVTDVRNEGEILFIHASTSKGVREDNLFSNYFKGRFVKAMRPF
jgi:probable lipoprotein NlpC